MNDIRQELDAKRREIVPLAERAAVGELAGDDLTNFRRINGELTRLVEEEREAVRSEEERQADREAAVRILDDHRRATEPVGRRASGVNPRGEQSRDGEATAQGRSIGEQFVRSREFEEYRQHGVGRGMNSGRVTVDHGFDERALITSTTVTTMIQPQIVPGIFAANPRPLTLRAALPNGQTDTNLVEFVREASVTNNAAEVAEATALNNGLKPESGFTLESDTAPVRTIAHMMYVTRAALDDMSGLQAQIDSRLRRGIEERIDRQLLIGDGSAPNLEGLNVVSGSQALNETYYDAMAATYAVGSDRLRHAITKIATTGGGNAGLIIMNPADIELMELMRTNATTGNNEYAMPGGGPFGNGVGPTRLWGVPVIPHVNQTAGQATVLDPSCCMVYDRMQTQIFITDSNRDLFERNILTILCETRLAFAVFLPSQIAIVDLTATA